MGIENNGDGTVPGVDFRSFIQSTVLQLIDTNQGDWEDKLITLDQIKREYQANPLSMALLMCWAISTMLFVEQQKNEAVDIDSDSVASFASHLLSDVMVALITTHNLEVAGVTEEDGK